VNGCSFVKNLWNMSLYVMIEGYPVGVVIKICQ
jgi:hypothetical protein